jgi:hypothetical protein
MAALSDPVNKQNIVDRFADYVRDTANSGISWGTNAYPFGEWTYGAEFGGSTGGKGIEINGDSIAGGGNGEIVAQYIYDTLITETYRYSKIRNLRARLNVTGGGGNNGSRPSPGIVYDQTAVAYMNDNYRQGVSAARDNVYVDNTITSGGLEVMFSNMRGAYNWARGNTVAAGGEWTTNVCHASCHSSCHSSRGRR